MSIKSSGQTAINNLKNAIINLISLHNSDSNAHSTEMAKKVDVAQGSGNKNKNIVTDSSGNITTEAKPTIPTKTSDLTNDSNFVSSINIDNKEDTSNKVSSWSSTTNDTHYPSEKLVKDSLDEKADASHTHGNLTSDGKVGTTRSRFVVTTEGGALTTTSNYTTSSMAKVGHTHVQTDITDFPTIPAASSTTPSADTINGSVGTGSTWAKADHTHPQSSIYSDASHTHGKADITDFPTIPTKTSDLSNDSGFLTSHQDISGKIDTAGTGLSKSGTTLNHSNSITAQTTNVFKKFKYDAQGHITGTANVTSADLPSHTHSEYLTSHQSLDSKTVTVEKQTTAEDGYIATYVVKQNNTQVGSKINIPKDYLVKSATVNTCSTTGTPTGFTKGDKYIDFVINTKDSSGTNEHIYLNVNDLVDAYTAGAGLELTNSNEFKHSNSVTAQTSLGFKKIKYDAQGHITGTADVVAADLPTHYHSQYLSSHQDISGKEDTSNKVSSWSSTTTDTHYPSEKLVKDSLDGKAASTHNHTKSQITDFPSSMTPTSHASTSTTYGAASTTNYGHAKLSTSTSSTSTSLAATPSAVKAAYDLANGKANASHTHGKADITDLPTIPTKTSDLTNDSGFLTSHQSLSNYVQTDDSRLSDARTPTSHTHTKSEISDFPSTMTPSSHTHGNITNAGAIGSTANKPVITTTSGKLTTGSFGTTANTFCQGNDSRLSDARTPTSHTHTKSEISDFPSSMTPSSHTHTKSEITDFPSSMTPSSHTHGNITNDGKLGTTSGKPVITTTGGAITTGSFGTSSGQFAEGNHTHSNYLTSHNPVDSALSDSSTNAVQNKVINTALNGKANSSHNHTKSEITDFPTTMTPSSHTHGNLQNDGTVKVSGTVQKTKNIVTDANGNLTAEDKPTIPSGSSTATDIKMNGTQSAGSSSNFAKADHIHPTDTSRASTSTATTSANGLMSSTDKTKLDGIASGANAYSHPSTKQCSYSVDISGKEDISNKSSSITTDTGSTTKYPTVKAVEDYAQAKGNYSSSGHTHDDRYYTESEIDTKLSGKVDTVSGKGLSTNDFNGTYKSYVDNLVSSSNTTKNAHVHGNIGSGGTLNSDITTVNKIAVTDSNNNLKTISKLPYAKVDGTPTLATVATSGKATDISSDITDTYGYSLFSEGSDQYIGLFNEKLVYDAHNDIIDYKGHELINNNDSRLTNSRTPTSHAHGDITNDGKIGSTSGKPIITTTGGKLTTGTFGTSSGQFAEGNHTHSNYLTSHQDISGKEDTSNKSSSITTDTGSTTKYPTVKAVEDYAQPKQVQTSVEPTAITTRITNQGTIFRKSGNQVFVNFRVSGTGTSGAFSTNTTSYEIFSTTLPESFRPPENINVSMYNSGTATRWGTLLIDTDGKIKLALHNNGAFYFYTYFSYITL